ncbi:helix-turn-helix transcriptional regulator [Micromonospora sp. D93]|uniref:TetR/AcrR family transcriptional regulator n=1 Tax=Micromonospora sp. D93 TaxID=2824886 RepID=UPI001B36EC00|nr:helix-turn-helix domain-containing protein [Micromonospora sp. D93]MBQ1020220.1 helix-turn-helix transcriptional regulator [Micromonospora sp. D93]
MGRPRGFDEQAVTAAAAELFAVRAYDGVSVDDLVQQLGVHRNSLYKTFGSKRGLYLAALRWHLEHRLPSLTEQLAADAAVADGSALDLLLLAAVERAPNDVEVATLVAKAWQALDQALQRASTTPADDPRSTALDVLLGERLRIRAAPASADPW